MRSREAPFDEWENEPREAKILEAFLQSRSYLARIIGRIVKRPQVEDVLQDTFLSCFEASSKIDIRNPQAFMAKVATNIALNHIARADNKTENRVAASSESSVDLIAESPEEGIDAGEAQRLFARAVGRLPFLCRQAFVLKKVYGMSRKEVAQHLGISESTAQKHIAKGTVMCMEYMEAMLSSAPRRRPSRPGARKRKP